ncbi:hypothetical protein GEMRC1_013966 [Eukaryota sp. GEM-RC1]
MTEPLLKIARSSNDTPQTTDDTLETVSSPCVSSLQPTEDQPDTISDSLLLRKPSIHFQESLLILVDLHLVKRLIQSMLNKCNRKFNPYSYLGCLFHAFFKKSWLFKVFLQSSTIPLKEQDLHSVSSINSFFGTDVRSVSLNIEFDPDGDSGSQMDTILGFKSICTHLDSTKSLKHYLNQVSFDSPLSGYFSQLSLLLDISSEFFLPHLRGLTFVTGNPSDTETFTLLCNTIVTNTVLLELDIEFYSITYSEAITVAEVLYLTNRLKKISLSGIHHHSDEDVLVLFNAISKNVVIESLFLSFSSDNPNIIFSLFNSSSLKKIEFYYSELYYGELTENAATNLTVTELVFTDSYVRGEVLTAMVNCCTCLRKLVIESKERSRNSFLLLFKALEANTSLLEVQVINSHSRKSLTDDEVQSLSKMLENNTTLLVLNFDLSVNSCQFVNIVNGLKMNSTLLETKLSFYAVDLNCSMLIFEEFAVNKLNSSIYYYSHCIDVHNGVLCFSPDFFSNPIISSEELSSLRCFLECFSIKELTLKKCRFTQESITALCDLIRSNTSLTSVDFSDFKFVELTPNGTYQWIDNFDSYDHYSNLINAIQCNSRLTTVTLSNCDIGLKTLLTIFELVSTNKITSNIDISPHLIDFSRGSIFYTPKKLIVDELVLRVDFLRLNRDIKHSKCPHYQIDTDDDVFCLQGIGDYKIPEVTVEVVSSLRCFLECFSIKELTLKKCEFTKESITALCDLIMSNNSLTSVNFGDLIFVELTAMLSFFELVSTIKFTLNIEISPHLIDFSRGSIFYTPKKLIVDELVLLVDFLRQNRDIKHFECPLYQIDTDDDNRSNIWSSFIFAVFFGEFQYQKLTLKKCEFTKESITALCDLIRSNNSLTSVNFGDFLLRELTPNGFYQRIDNFDSYDHYSNLINAIQCNSRLTKVTLSNSDMGIKTLLNIFELVSNNKLTSNIDISPHLIDFSSGAMYYYKYVEDDDLICLLNALKSDVIVKSVDCKGSSIISVKGLIALFEVISFNKSVIDVDISPHLINVGNGVFRFSKKSESLFGKPDITTVDCISLQNFLNRFSIKELSFEGCLFSVESFSILCDSIKAHNSLTSVELWGCNLSESGFLNVITALQFKSCFKIIDLDNSNVKPKSLFRCLDVILAGKLTPTIEISNCVINVETGVFNLSFESDTQVTADEVSSLQCFLQCFNMKRLILRGCIFTNEAVAILGDIIRTIQLTFVDFSYCNLSHLFGNISEPSNVFSPSITMLDLRCNRIGSEGARALAEALKVNSTIIEIYLDKNSIGPEGARALAEALKVNSTIIEIYLDKNSIGPEGARALGEALKVNSTITHISLFANSIGSEGARALAEALKVNSTVAEIYLDENSIGPEGARALAEALKVNSAITYINLSKNSIRPEDARALVALKVNARVIMII